MWRAVPPGPCTVVTMPSRTTCRWSARSLITLGAALVVGVLYGSILWGVLPGQPGVSWEAHLFGAVDEARSARQNLHLIQVALGFAPQKLSALQTRLLRIGEQVGAAARTAGGHLEHPAPAGIAGRLGGEGQASQGGGLAGLGLTA